jgi:3-oxoacyl-[acyl-carrier protein] reductase
MAGRLVEKVAIVTGAGFGFGEGITKRFIEEGARVIIVDINIENGERVAAAQPHGTAVFIPGDVSVESDWKKAVNTALSAFGKIDIVVNNAGVVNMAMVRFTSASFAFLKKF